MDNPVQHASRIPRLCMLSVAIVLIAVPATGAAAPKPAATCENIDGTFHVLATPVLNGNDLVGFEVVAKASTGPLSGLATASLTVEKILPDGTIHLVGSHTFPDTTFGTLITSDKITLAPNGRVHNHLTIIEGASGSFHTRGDVNFETGEGQLRYHGRVCV